ncbi:MAG: T9SS type A sorting domain-containing protein, partial [Psychroflexus sp.]|nr:T9SS type A sorting domain-containing protein [Psychroflexus sp.]
KEDVVFGGDFFDATGSYTTDASGNVDTFTLTWSNGFGDGGTNDYALNSIISCVDPQNFEITNSTLSSVDFSWDDSNDPGTTFEINYGAPGFTAGSGTSVNNISGTSTTISGLSDASVFEAYIRANCGSSDNSEWVGPLEFFTLADCATEFSGFPLTENYDNAAVFGSCYTVIDEDGNGTAWIQQELELQPLTPSFFATNGTNDAQKEDYLFSPALTMTAGNTYDISVSYNGADAQNGAANEDLEVLVASGNTVADANSGTSVFTDTNISQNGAFADVEAQALTGTGQFVPTTSGDYHIVLKSTGSPLQIGGTTGFLLIFEYSVDETLSTEDFETFNFNYFVDVQNKLNLSANQAFDQVTLHNLLGQQVLSQELSNQNESVDLNNLSSGVYLAQVQINDSTKTFKIVKK